MLSRSRDRRTSEGDLLDLHVMSYGIANSVAVADENVDDTGRETSLDEVGHAGFCQGSEPRWLESNGTSRCQGRSDFPGQHEYCVR